MYTDTHGACDVASIFNTYPSQYVKFKSLTPSLGLQEN